MDNYDENRVQKSLNKIRRKQDEAYNNLCEKVSQSQSADDVRRAVESYVMKVQSNMYAFRENMIGGILNIDDNDR